MSGRRISARIIVLDEDDAVLLFCGSDPAITDGSAPRWWFTVGGQVLPGEPLEQTAARELAEETGLHVAPAAFTGPVWRRESPLRFNGQVLDSDEYYFLHRTRRFEPSPAGRTELELRYIHGHRWCDAAAMDRLAAAGERIYPLQLPELLEEAVALAELGGPPPAAPRPIR